MPTSSWKMYSKKTKDSYVQHVREVVYAVISTIFPYEIQQVLEDFYNLSTDTTMEQTNEADSVLQEALIESCKRQIPGNWKDKFYRFLPKLCTTNR